MIDWLGGTFVATSFLLALVLLVREPVRRQFGPAAAYGLWLIPALRLAMPPLVDTVERIIPATQPVVLHSAAAATIEPSLIDRLGGWPTVAVAVWLIGAAVMLAGGIVLYRWQRREVLRDGVQLARLGNVRIVQSPAVSGPMAFGILDRVIAVPIDFDERFDPQERRLAFDHELAHHRSGDLIVSHFAFALLCLQWFNPLAWVSHAAFRFDQEAACDARVLCKAIDGNRAAYAQAIAKAASGRALLFAGALDRPRTLHRRLQSMLTNPSNRRRVAGKALIVVAAAAALPLTASRATEYVDVAAPARTASAAAQSVASTRVIAPAPVRGAALAAASAAATSPEPEVRKNNDGTVTLSGGVKLDRGSIAFFDDDTVLINGERKRVDQLTPAELSKMRTTIVKSQGELAKERAELPARLAEAQQELAKIRSGEFKAELLRDHQDLQRDLAEIDSEAAEIRANGEDPAKRKAEILRDLKELDSMDIDKQVSEALEEANPAKITAELQSAEAQMTRLLARINQLDRQ